MSNYYTPKIEEIHVGFECEFKNQMQLNIWEEEICNVDTVGLAYDSFEHGSVHHDDAFEDTFRVKYLDEEDIESLGFKRIFKDQYHIDWEGRDVMLLIDNDMRCQLINEEDRIEDYLFQGIIKNKSELKRILKMIGVLE